MSKEKDPELTLELGTLASQEEADELEKANLTQTSPLQLGTN